MESNDIEGVLNENKEVVDLKTTEVDSWISEIHISGNKKKQVQAFLIVQTLKGFGELIKNHIPILKEESIKLKI